jgi:hypothetical protein
MTIGCYCKKCKKLSLDFYEFDDVVLCPSCLDDSDRVTTKNFQNFNIKLIPDAQKQYDELKKHRYMHPYLPENDENDIKIMLNIQLRQQKLEEIFKNMSNYDLS